MRVDLPIVVTAATNRNLATLENVRLEFGLTDHSEDAQLRMWLRQASGLIERRCDPHLVNETFTQQFNNLCRAPSIKLHRYPVVVITSVVEDDVTLTIDDDYRYGANDGIIYRQSGGVDCEWSATKVIVTHSAGYTLGDDLPLEIERAVIEQVKAYRFGAERNPLARNIEVANAGSEQIWFDSDPDGLCPAARGLISGFTTRTNW